MAKKQTYADRAKTIMNKYKPRLGENFDKGDTLALEAMNQELTALQQEQEQARAAKQQADAAFQDEAIQTFRDGGKLNKKQQKNLSSLLEEQKEIRKGGLPEVFEEVREGEPEDIKAMRHMGVMPKLPGVHPGKYAYGGKIPQKASLSSTGLAAGKKPSQYSEQQLRLGIDVEHEHTKNNALAVKIAMDHLEENPMYYGKGGKKEAEQLAQQHAAADAAKYAKGGMLPKYDGTQTKDQYLQQAQAAAPGFNQIPYGQPAYPYPQYYGDKMQDYLGAFQGTPFNMATGQYQAGDFSNPQMQVSPYDLIKGRSPMDPLQRGAQAQPNPLASPGMDELQAIAQGGYRYNPNQVGSPQSIMAPGNGQPATAGTINQTATGTSGSKTAPSDKPAQKAATTGGGSATGGGGSNLPPVATVDPWTEPDLSFIQDDINNFDYSRPNTPQGSPQANQGSAIATGQGQFDPYKSRVPWWGAAATGLGNVLANRQLDLPAGENIEDVTAQQISPRLVDYSRSREQIQRERDRAQAAIRQGAKGRGTQQGLTQSTIAGATATQGVAGQQFTQSQEAEANKNAQIKQSTSMFNAQQRSQAQNTNLRNAMYRQQLERENQLINASRRSQQISGVAGAITQYGQDRMAAGQYDQLVNMRMADKDYKFIQDDPMWWNKVFGVTEQAQVGFTNPNLRVSG